MKIRLVTVIWGADFIDMFLRLGLRSLLDGGNLPHLARTHRVTYTLYTTAQDAKTLEAAPAFARLRALVDVHFSRFSTSEIDPSFYGSHGTFWERGLELARRNREILFFLIPDMIYAAGTLARWSRRLEEGKRAVFTPGAQVALETFLPELEARFPDRQREISLPVEEMTDLLFRHLHPLVATMLRGAPRRIGHPEWDLRGVPGRGFVARMWIDQPFCLDPNFFFRLRHFSPCDHLDRVAFEPCTMISVEPILKHASWYYRPRPLDETQITQLGSWWDHFAPPGCVLLSKQTQDFRLCDDETWHAGRRRAVNSGRFMRSQLAITTKLYQLFLELRKLGLNQAAMVLAAAVLGARLRRRIAPRNDAVLLVPSDVAFDRRAVEHLWKVLSEGGSAALLRLISNHVVVRARSGGAVPAYGAPPDGRMVSGLPFEQVTGDVKVLNGPTIVCGFTVYVIDRILWPEPPPRAVASAPNRRLRAAARRARLRRRAAQLEGLARYAFHWAERRRLWRYQVRRLAALWVYFRQNGHHAARALIYRKIYARLEEIAVVRWLYRRVMRSYRLAKRCRAGVRSAIMALRRIGRAPAPAIEKPRILGGAQSLLDEVRIVRALQGAEEALAHYQREVLGDRAASSALAFVRERLHSVADRSDLPTILETALRRLLEEHPTSAEVAFELGCLLLDQARVEEALVQLSHASRGDALHDDLAPWDTVSARDPRAQAAAELGHALVHLARDKEACEAFTQSLIVEPEQTDIRAALGHCLVRMGDWKSAMTLQFSGAMVQSFSRWCVPRTGRDLHAVRLSQLERLPPLPQAHEAAKTDALVNTARA